VEKLSRFNSSLLLETFRKTDLDQILEEILAEVKSYEISKTGYLDLFKVILTIFHKIDLIHLEVERNIFPILLVNNDSNLIPMSLFVTFFKHLEK
jgi:hypothetical protein